jgi:hypothetical protein
MNLLKNNRDLNRLLDRKAIVIFAFNYTACYLIRPMPRTSVDYNHSVYWHYGIPYIITQCDDRYITQAQIVTA